MADDDKPNETGAEGEGGGDGKPDGDFTLADRIALPVADNAPKGKDGEPFDPERAQRTIDALRAEARDGKKAAKERDDALAKLKTIEDAQKSELEREQERARDLEAKVAAAEVKERETNLKLAVFEKANDLGIASPTLALRALDRDAIEYDDQGQPTNLNETLGELLEREPILKGQPGKTPTGRINAGSGGGGKQPTLTAAELEMAAKTGMTAEEYEKFKTPGAFTESDYRKIKGETPAAA